MRGKGRAEPDATDLSGAHMWPVFYGVPIVNESSPPAKGCTDLRNGEVSLWALCRCRPLRGARPFLLRSVALATADIVGEAAATAGVSAGPPAE